MAPVEGPTSGTPYLSSSATMPWVWGVPRVMNSASTPLSSMSVRALSCVSLGSNLSSSATSSIFCPFTPPRALTWSRYSDAPSIDSLTVAAADPVMPTV